MTPKFLLPHDLVEHLSTINFDAVNKLWNRSKISFTPLDSSSGNVLQIKSRIFDQGLSGTLMLAHRAPTLDDYYEPGKEYVPFGCIEECADKARFYLRNEASRRKIAEAYAARTRSEHLWSHRIQNVLRDAGLE
jgi:spore maturation protein CgeB